jgi:hypothetical membrane protein
MATAPDRKLLAGPAISMSFLLGTTGLALLVPGYSQLRQTISEIGSLDSPMRMPFAVLVVWVGIFELVFAFGMRAAAAKYHRSQATTYLLAVSAAWSFGIAIFADPHPLHGVFGDLGLVAMLSPFVFAFTWRKEPRARSACLVSWLFGIIIWGGIFSFTPWAPWPAEFIEQYLGVIQRIFLYSWMAWCGVIGLQLRSLPR